MRRVHVSIPVPECAFTLAAAVAPVLGAVRMATLSAWIAARTWGMRPDAPYHADYARLRSAIRGGVRIR